MRPSELIQEVLERESLRLLTWADEHAPETVARPAVAYAFARTWSKAASCWRTPHGPAAFLLTYTERGIQARPPLIGTYLAPTARRTYSVPTMDEIHQACLAYAWIGAAAVEMRLAFTTSSMVVAAVNAAGRVSLVERTVLLNQYEPSTGKRVFLRLLDVADHLATAEGPALDRVSVECRRELERSRRWLADLPTLSRG